MQATRSKVATDSADPAASSAAAICLVARGHHMMEPAIGVEALEGVHAVTTK